MITNIFFDGHRIEIKKRYKYLGLSFTSKLFFYERFKVNMKTKQGINLETPFINKLGRCTSSTSTTGRCTTLTKIPNIQRRFESCCVLCLASLEGDR